MGELKTICLDCSDANADWIKAVTTARLSGTIRLNPAKPGLPDSVMNSFEGHAGIPGHRGGSLPKGVTQEPEYKIKGSSDSDVATFEAGGRSFKGMFVEPFPLPPAIPTENANIATKAQQFMQSVGGSERFYIDYPARRMWWMEKAKPDIKYIGDSVKPSVDGWVVKSAGSWYPNPNTVHAAYTDEIFTARPVLPEDSVGSAAYMKRLGVTYSCGAAYDEDLNLGHEYSKEDGVPRKEQDITDPNNIPASIGGVFRYEGRMEAKSLEEKCKLPSLDEILKKDNAEAFLSDKSKEYVKARQDKTAEAYKKVSEMSRGDALEYLNDSKERAERKNEKAYQEAAKVAEAIPHTDDAGLEKVSAFWKDYFKSNITAARMNAFSVVKDAVVRDFITSLVPKYPVYDDKKIKFKFSADKGVDVYESSVNTEKAEKFINSSINPASIADMAAKPVAINWRPSLVGEGGIHAYDRSYYSGSQNEIVMRPDADDATVAHEIGHHLGQVTFGDNYGRDFIYDRAERTTIPLRRMTGDLGYTPDEVAHADRFVNPYVGKEYPRSTTEVISMGLEHMMRDPVWFYQHDREHFLFTAYVMSGGLRKGYKYQDEKLKNANRPLASQNPKFHPITNSFPGHAGIPGHQGGSLPAIDSYAKHHVAGGEFTADRTQLHDRIVRQLRSGVPVSEHPEFVLMGGGTAAGKSNAVHSGSIRLPDRYVSIDSDAIKTKLPEYTEMLMAGDHRAASYVHEESSHLAKRAMREAFTDHQDMVLDGTGNSSLRAVQEKTDAARAAGFTVRGEYVTCPTDVAVARAKERGERTGREVPETMVRAIHASVSRIFPEAVKMGLYDTANLWDTSAGKPVLVASAKGKDLTVHDHEKWQQFLAKGNV